VLSRKAGSVDLCKIKLLAYALLRGTFQEIVNSPSRVAPCSAHGENCTREYARCDDSTSEIDRLLNNLATCKPVAYPCDLYLHMISRLGIWHKYDEALYSCYAFPSTTGLSNIDFIFFSFLNRLRERSAAESSSLKTQSFLTSPTSFRNHLTTVSLPFRPTLS